jgi:hypothetical protein
MKHYGTGTIGASQFSEPIEIVVKSGAVDAYNVKTDTYSVLFNLRAQYNPQTVINKFTADKMAVINRVLFRVRKDPGILPEHYVQYRMEKYRVAGIQKVGQGRGAFVEIVAEKIT